MTDGFSSIVKLIAHDTSLFSIVQNKNNSASPLNNDLDKMSDWAYTWRIFFNPDPSLYKAFIRPHLDYGDIVYDKPNNETFVNKIEKAQHDAALATTGAIRRTSREKLYAELGLESLKYR